MNVKEPTIGGSAAITYRIRRIEVGRVHGNYLEFDAPPQPTSSRVPKRPSSH
ncbi:hypothetical protein KIN20_020640 [Parelaphostrongylus tenuis]|uniref:Uncharacterized protein n=1 Tax=Parelaphostrongylus tenuis TaxID=148309 RepID=A0AAD5MMR5_PARTN|nr:hypothetical protein KIN20_020640 [Parelaphostrongylus tenuis]